MGPRPLPIRNSLPRLRPLGAPADEIVTFVLVVPADMTNETLFLGPGENDPVLSKFCSAALEEAKVDPVATVPPMFVITPP